MTIQWSALQLAGNTRLFQQPDGRIRLRKGVWNFEEASISFDPEQQRAADMVAEICLFLASGKKISEKQGEKISEEPQAVETIRQLLAAGYLQQQSEEQVDRLLLGTAAPRQWTPPGGDILMFCDSVPVSQQLLSQARTLNIPLREAADGLAQQCGAGDLTAAVDGFETEESIRLLEQQLPPFWALLVVQQHLNLTLLRNLNHLLLRREQPAYLLLAYVDGPFTGLTVLKPGETACFGCLEYRIMSRLQDHRLYQQFATHHPPVRHNALPFSPLLQWQADLALGELLTLTRCGLAKLLGRVLNFYLPSYEIQFQNVMRSAQCPACGYAMRSRLHELNVRADLLLGELRHG